MGGPRGAAVGAGQEAPSPEAGPVTEQPREFIREFLASEPDGIGVHLRDGRHLAGDFVSFDGETLRLELSGGRPKFNRRGECRPEGPVVEIDFEEIVRVMIEDVIEDRAAH
jgi:hypothetical protein